MNYPNLIKYFAKDFYCYSLIADNFGTCGEIDHQIRLKLTKVKNGFTKVNIFLLSRRAV